MPEKTKAEQRADAIACVARWLRQLIAPGQVAELRALHVRRPYSRPHTEAGYYDYDHIEKMAEDALTITGDARGVYFALNPVRPDLLARRANRIDFAEEGTLTKDGDIISRRWLLVDADPVRDAHISSSAAEKAAALETVKAIRADLEREGWPAPVLADSGNGFHMLFAVDLPAYDEGLIERCLKALATNYDNPAVHIDQTVFNPARIVKLPGTLARKGDHIPDRPHRRSKLLEAPSDLQNVPRELLEALAAKAPEADPFATPNRNGTAKGQHSSGTNGEYTSRLIVEKWLQDRGIEYRVKDQPDGKGRTVYVLKCCPFNSAHGDPSASIMQALDGRMSAHCFHNGCAGSGWQKFKEAIGAPERHHYDPPLKPPRNKRKAKSDKAATPAVPPPADGEVVEAFDDPHRLARHYRNSFNFHDVPTLHFHRQTFIRWEDSAYRTLNEKEVRAELTEVIKTAFDEHNLRQIEGWKAKGADGNPPKAPKVTREAVSNAMQALAGISLLSGAVESPAWIGDCKTEWGAGDMLACRNALVHLPFFVDGKTPYCIDPTPLFFSPNRVDFGFDLNTLAPANWHDFLAQLWKSDPQAIEALQEWFGYCLLPDTSQQKILMLVGPKRSGKGTIARVLRALIGAHNVAGPTLASLGTNFGLQPLLDKPLAVISDARLSGRSDAAIVVERLLSISGEDAQTVDRKHLAPLTLKLSARFMILTNELPKLNDPSGALVGRMILLRLTETFFGTEDTRLTAKLLGELPGILLWAIEGWKRLRQRGHFQQPESGANLLRHLEDLSSPIHAFIRERCEVGPGFTERCSDLFEQWKKWCEPRGHKPGNDQTFGRDLRAAVLGLDTRNLRFGAMRQRVYSGIRLDPAAIEADAAFC